MGLSRLFSAPPRSDPRPEPDWHQALALSTRKPKPPLKSLPVLLPPMTNVIQQHEAYGKGDDEGGGNDGRQIRVPGGFVVAARLRCSRGSRI